MKLVTNKDKDYHLCDFVTAQKGNVKLVRAAYGKAAHNLRFSDGRAFRPLLIRLLELAASRKRLGPVTTTSIPVVGRSLPIGLMSMEQIFSRFAYVQRALASLLDIGLINNNPMVYGALQEKNLSLAISDPEAVCEFLISFIQYHPVYGTEDDLIEQLQTHLVSRLKLN